MVQRSSILKASHLYKSIETDASQIALLHDINLTSHAGESIAIMGSSGSGKTTLLSILAGIDEPSKGDIWILNKKLSSLSDMQKTKLRAQHIGFIFQQFHLIESLTALENVLFAMHIKGIKDVQEKAKEALVRVGLSKRFNHYPHMLSGGEQQRVAISRAYACMPSIIFADEPTGNLDNKTAKLITSLIFELNQTIDTTLIIVTHDTYLASQCQRQFQLENGQLNEYR